MYLIKVWHIKHNMEPLYSCKLAIQRTEDSKPNQVTQKIIGFLDIFTLNHWFLPPVN
jgi:hypothetical protein